MGFICKTAVVLKLKPYNEDAKKLTLSKIILLTIFKYAQDFYWFIHPAYLNFIA